MVEYNHIAASSYMSWLNEQFSPTGLTQLLSDSDSVTVAECSVTVVTD